MYDSKKIMTSYNILCTPGAPNSAKFRGGGVAEVAKIDATTWVYF